MKAIFRLIRSKNKRNTKKKDRVKTQPFLNKPGDTCFPSSLPNKYHRRCRLNFRIRDGNGCVPTSIVTKKFQ